MSAFSLSRYSRWIPRLKTLQLQSKQLSSSSFFSTTADNESPRKPSPPPIRIGLTESAGRGVFATRRITAGELIHTAKPILSHPSLSSINNVCYFCLRKLKGSTSTDSRARNVSFCSEECMKNSKVLCVIVVCFLCSSFAFHLFLSLFIVFPCHIILMGFKLSVTGLWYEKEGEKVLSFG